MGTRRWSLDRPELVPPRLKEYLGPRADYVDFLVAYVKELAVGDPLLEGRTTRMGAPSYDRQMLLAVWLYGLRLGVTSTRKLEEACRYRTDFMYLTGREQPDHSTLWLFFKEYGPRFRDVLKRLIAVLRKVSLVRGDAVLIDGTTIASKGSRHKIRGVSELEASLAKLDRELGSALEKAGEGEEEEALVAPEAGSQEALREQIRAALAEEREREELDIKKVCLTDPESAILRFKDYGSGPGYNVQMATDADEGIVLSVEATTDKTDYHQLARQTTQAAEILGENPRAVVGDAGYHVADELAEVEKMGIKVFCPQKANASNQSSDPFSAQYFVYDEARAILICPAGKELKHAGIKEKKTGRTRVTLINIFKAGSQCLECPNFGICTKCKKGRQVKRQLNNDASMRTQERNQTEEGQGVIRKRRRIEHRFSHLKNRMNIRRVWMTGRAKVTQFLTLAAIAMNLDIAFAKSRLTQKGRKQSAPLRELQEPLCGAPESTTKGVRAVQRALFVLLVQWAAILAPLRSRRTTQRYTGSLEYRLAST